MTAQDIKKDKRKQDIHDLLLILITFLMTCALWFMFADFFVQEAYCRVHNSFLNETNISFYHIPSMIQDNSKDEKWKNESYKDKYLR